MPTTTQNMKNLILIQVGEHNGGPVTTVIDTLWSMYSDKAGVKNAPRLQYCYVLKEALNITIAALTEGRFTSVGNIQNQAVVDAQLKFFQDKLIANQAEIEKLEKVANSVNGYAIGQIAQTAPIMPADSLGETDYPDANSRRLRGDPYYRPIINDGGNRF